MPPLISIVIPTYNRGPLLAQTLRSVRAQEYAHWEALVVDDGSTDDTEKLMQDLSLADPRFRFISRAGERSGGNRCRNIGMQQSKGDYLIFLDSDDYLAPHCLQQRVTQVNNDPGLDFYVFPGFTFSQDSFRPEYYWNVETGLPDTDRFLHFDSPWQTTGALWRKSGLTNHRLAWDEELGLWQDVDFHLGALLAGLGYRVNWQLPCDYGVRSNSADSLSRQDFYHKTKIGSRIYFWKKYLGRLPDLAGKLSPRLLRPTLLAILRDCAVSRQWERIGQVLHEAQRSAVIDAREYRRMRIRSGIGKWSRNRIPFPDEGTKKKLHGTTDTIQRIHVG